MVSAYSVVTLITLIYTTLVSLFVLVRRPYARANQLYALYGLSILVWAGGSFWMSLCQEKQNALLAARLLISGGLFVPLAGYHFSAQMSESRKDLRLMPLLYFINIVLALFCNYTDMAVVDVKRFTMSFYPRGTLYLLLTGLLYYVYSLRSIYILWHRMMSLPTTEANQRTRLLCIFFAMTVSTISGAEYVPALLNVDYFPIGHILTYVMLSIIAYAVVRHKLMDIDVVIRKTLIFGGLFVVAYGVVAGLAYLSQDIFQRVASGTFSLQTDVIARMHDLCFPMNSISLSGFVLGLTCLFFGILILRYGTNKTHLTFAVQNLLISLWGFCFGIGALVRSPDIALFFWRIAHVGGIFLIVVLLHHVLLMNSLRQNKILSASYVVAALFPVLFLLGLDGMKVRYMFNSCYFPVIASPIYRMYLLMWLGIGSYITFLIIRAYNDAAESEKRVLGLYSFAYILGLWGGGAFIFLVAFNINILYPYSNYLIPIYLAMMTYAIVRYKLLNIEVLVRKTLVFAGLFVVVYGLIAAAAYISQGFLQSFLSHLLPSNSFTVKINALAISGFLIGITCSFLTLFILKFSTNKVQSMFGFGSILKIV